VGSELDVGPLAGSARLATELWGNALPVGLEALGWLDIERLIPVPPDEFEGEFQDNIGAICPFGEVQDPAVLVDLRFPVPAAGSIVGEEFVKALSTWQLAQLTPLACRSRSI
jgi:hypothetical protein